MEHESLHTYKHTYIHTYNTYKHTINTYVHLNRHGEWLPGKEVYRGNLFEPLEIEVDLEPRQLQAIREGHSHCVSKTYMYVCLVRAYAFLNTFISYVFRSECMYVCMYVCMYAILVHSCTHVVFML